jgi:ankyrin repeat protein
LDSNSYDLLQSVILKQYEFFGLFDDTFDSELKEQTPITQNYTHENESSLVAPNSASCLASSTQLTTSTSPSTSVTSSQSDDGVLSISRKTLPQPGFILWGNRARTAEDKTAELVKSCIEGNMHEIYSLISDGADLNQADKSGMTPFLGAYWGLNLDVVKYLNSKEAKIVSSELAEQELIRLNKYNVIAEAKEANTPQKLYAWMCSIGKDMHGARGVIESFAAALAENATLIWNQKKNCLIAHIEEYKNIRVGYCPSESEYPKKFVLERHKECKELMLKLSVAPLITTTAQSDLKEKKQTGSKEEKKATAVIGQFFQQQLSVEEKAAALVKSCISGNLQEVQFLVAQGVNVNQPDKTGMTPLLGAYWGLNIDIIRFLSSNGLTLMISEKADQELIRLNKFDVITTFKEAYSPKRLYDWMCHVDKDLYGSRGIISAYAASVAVDHKMVWDDKKKDLEASFKKINGLCFVPEVVPYNCLIIQKEKLKKLIEVFTPQVSTQKVISNSKSN